MEECLIIIAVTCLCVIYIHYYSKKEMSEIINRRNLLSEIFMVLDESESGMIRQGNGLRISPHIAGFWT